MVTSGLFGFSRNPMYVGMVAIAIGMATVLGTVVPMAIGAGFTVVLALVFVPMEEKSMEKVFGERWREYKRHVRRWL